LVDRDVLEKTYAYKKALTKVYGLTPRMIEELGEPDAYDENPHYRRGPEAKLYLIKRVETWVEANRDRVEKAKANRAKRSEAIRAAREEKRRQRWDEASRSVEEVSFHLERPLPVTLLDDARKWYQFPREGDPLESNALRAYVRHHLTNFKTFHQKLLWSPFRRELRQRLRERADEFVNRALADWKDEQTRSCVPFRE
jgi:hypothetical protein